MSTYRKPTISMPQQSTYAYTPGPPPEPLPPGELPIGPLTPRQSAEVRQADMTAGRRMWQDIVGGRQDYRDNLNRAYDMSWGLNAGQMSAARDLAIRGMQGKEQNAIRSLYSQQARSGVRGGMAGAQQARLQRQAMADRQAGEHKLMLDNYAIQRQGLQDYTQAVNRDISGELSTGIGNTQMGVADRAAATQDMINYAMQRANNRNGFLGLW